MVDVLELKLLAVADICISVLSGVSLMQAKSIQKNQRRKNKLLEKINKVEEETKGVTINEKDERKRRLHLDLLGVAQRAKQEGIQ